MGRFLIRRVTGVAVLLFVISFVTYGLFNLVPSNPATLYCGKNCTPEKIAKIEKKLELDQPFLIQYGRWLYAIPLGRTYPWGQSTEATNSDVVNVCPAPCLGYSFRRETPVTGLITDAFPITFSIAIGAFVLWIVGGVTVGVISALRRGSLLDRVLMFLTLGGYSLPSFFTGATVLLFPIIAWGWYPIPHYVPFSQNPFEWAQNLLPLWIVIAILNAALYTRITRANMLETMNEDYIRTARAKGLSERRVIFKHGLRAALTPIVTIAGLDLGGLLGGAVITEKIFTFRGLGAVTVDAATNYDLPVLMAVTIIAAFFIIVANLIVDILYAAIDPKVRLS